MGKDKSAGSGREIYYWVIGTLAVVLAAYFFFGEKGSRQGAGPVRAQIPGSAQGVAPAFVLPEIGGGQVSLADLRGKVILLNFWATWCPPCRREIPDFISLQGQYGAQGLQIVGIGTDEPEKVRAYAQENGMNYPVLFGTDDVALKYGGIDAIPTTFLIDRQGRIVTKYVGLRSRAEFEQAIKKLL
jgi:cytochrome c biogenesis protein CcmG/thiol:disulfide interchange protein DsbE